MRSEEFFSLLLVVFYPYLKLLNFKLLHFAPGAKNWHRLRAEKNLSLTKKRPWRVCQKSSGACRNAKSLFERSEFDLADTETTNFWQRSRHSLDFSLILDFAHVQQIENKFSFVFTQPQNGLSFLLVKQKK